MKATPPLLRKTDLYIVATLLLIALILLCFVKEEQGNRAVVRVDGKILHTLSLDKDQAITVENNGIHLTVSVKSGQVYVSKSDCPDGICRKTGALSGGGQTIVCLPAACSITVEGTSSPPDAVTY